MPETRARPRAKPVKAELTEAAAAKLERDLRAVMKRSRQRHEAADAADAERDRVIRDAHGAGMTPKQIAEVTGLSDKRIDQIRRGSRL